MSHVFYGVWMVRQGTLGWASHTAWFGTTDILATIQLSNVSIQEPGTFQGFRSRYAMGYIETVNTPVITIGGWTFPNPNKLTDNMAWLRTNHVTFRLQAADVTSASAFGLIHDRSAGAGSLMRADVMRSFDLAVFDEDGTVVGTHTEAQLTDGRALEPQDDVSERILGRATAEADRKLDVVPVDLAALTGEGGFRIDTRTKRPIRLDAAR